MKNLIGAGLAAAVVFFGLSSGAMAAHVTVELDTGSSHHHVSSFLHGLLGSDDETDADSGDDGDSGHHGHVSSGGTKPSGSHHPSVDQIVQVYYPGGSFKYLGGSSWVERNKDGTFNYEESGRFSQEIKLWDADRQVHISLNLGGMQVLYAENGKPLRPLYQITKIK